MIPWFKPSNLRKLEDDKDRLLPGLSVSREEVGLSVFASRVVAKSILSAGGCRCSDDLAVVCEAHGSPRSEYALTVVTEYADMEISVCRRCHGWGCWPGPCGGDEKGA